MGLPRIGSQLSTLRRATMKHFHGAWIMTLHLVNPLFHHRTKWKAGVLMSTLLAGKPLIFQRN